MARRDWADFDTEPPHLKAGQKYSREDAEYLARANAEYKPVFFKNNELFHVVDMNSRINALSKILFPLPSKALLVYIEHVSGEHITRVEDLTKYKPPSRVGRRSINAFVLPELYDEFKRLSNDLGLSSDYLAHKAYALLLEDAGRQVPEAVKQRLSQPEAKRPGPPKGTPRAPRRTKG